MGQHHDLAQKYASMAAHDLQRAGHKHPNPLTLLALARLYKNLKGDNTQWPASEQSNQSFGVAQE